MVEFINVLRVVSELLQVILKGGQLLGTNYSNQNQVNRVVVKRVASSRQVKMLVWSCPDSYW